MSSSEKLVVLAARLETFRRVLRLELDRGCDNRAVMGGLDRFLDDWHKELVKDNESAFIADLKDWRILPPGYATLTSSQRATWAEGALEASMRLTNKSGPSVRSKHTLHMAVGRNPQEALGKSPRSLPGVGPRIAAKISTLGISTIRELLYHLPRRHIPVVAIRKLAHGEEQGVVGVVWETRLVKTGGSRRQATEAILSDETGNLRAIWFNQPFVARTLRVGNRIFVSGHLGRQYRGQTNLEVTSYEVINQDDEVFADGRLVPIYPSTEGLPQRTLRRIIRSALIANLNEIEDFLPEDIAQRQELLHIVDAVSAFHYPANAAQRTAARRRLAFNELFLIQVRMLIRKSQWQKHGSSQPIQIDQEALSAFLAALPFQLTTAQHRVLDETLTDMNRRWPMARLLQGEVGSGKTVVALAAMLMAAAREYQSAMMAPTEILAEQHFLTITRLLEPLSEPSQEANLFVASIHPMMRPITVGLLVGSHSRREKKAIYERLEKHSLDIVVGTHALIQDQVAFRSLNLVVVDEQHRFGVSQRQALGVKGDRPHILTMSATPIPRSLALTLYGDLDVSILDQLPPGRQTVRTVWLRPNQRGQAYEFLRKEVSSGHQAFVACPLIEESEALQTRAAVEEHRRLSENIYPNLRIGLLHGRMSLTEKTDVMQRFRDRELDILVSTPVIEVGVDIPNATVMLIEGADRFGLSSLHQFRGRVGRGVSAGTCILHADEPSAEAQERLAILEREPNGFRVAEEDLRLRGPGEFFGTRQSGIPDLKVADLGDLPLLGLARYEATRLLERDPDLISTEHSVLSEALRALESDEVGNEATSG